MARVPLRHESEHTEQLDSGIDRTQMLTIALIAQGLFLLGAMGISAGATLRTGSILRGGLYLYGLLILWIALCKDQKSNIKLQTSLLTLRAGG